MRRNIYRLTYAMSVDIRIKKASGDPRTVLEIMNSYSEEDKINLTNPEFIRTNILSKIKDNVI